VENNGFLDYVRESSKNTGIYYLNKDIPVWTEQPLSDSVDLNKVLSKIEKTIPTKYLQYIQAVRIGMFDEMIERELNALYKDGVLYVSNIQDNNQDILDDIIHEISHAVEQNNSEIVFGDGKIEQEFIGKRKRLYNILKSEGFNVTIEQFLNPKYDQSFDMYLFQEVGYPLLNSISGGLFLSAYSITSINEYFAVGFESFYIDKTPYLDKMCPQLSNKLNYLDEMANEY
jgi:ribosome-binding ATPase YchF (GTP1/OBG family)